MCDNQRFLTDSAKDGDPVTGYSVAANPAPWEWTPADNNAYIAGQGVNDLDDSGVMSGTIVYEPSYKNEPYGVSSNDLPFTHPFGNMSDPSTSFNDFEYFVKPDAPYNSELALGNGPYADPTSDYATAYAMAYGRPVSKSSSPTPVSRTILGVMGMEMDSGLVPKPYRAQVGDRIAMWGRWIVDCGHNMPAYHTEIHPPLMMATAHTLPSSSGSGPGTSVQILGRPYLVSQVCFDGAILKQSSTDDPNCHPSDIYGDGGCTDGGDTSRGEGDDLYDHLICELNHDVNSTSNVVHAEPDVYTVPFVNHVMTFYVDPPTATPPGSGYSLQLRYNLTIRDGVTVILNQDGRPGELRVEVILNSSAYVPAPLNPIQDRYLPWAQLEAMDPALSSDTVSGLNDLCSYAGTCGIHVGQYPNVYPSALDNPIDFTSGASQLLSSLKSASSGSGIQIDDSQPFPIIGWIQLQWCNTSLGCVHVGPAPSPKPVTLHPQPLMVLGTGNTVSPITNNCVGGTPPKFTGTIVTNGEKGSVTYEWQRSDGTTSPPETINISQGTSTVSVSTTWAPSTPGKYWAELVITSPQSTASNKANFQILLC